MQSSNLKYTVTLISAVLLFLVITADLHHNHIVTQAVSETCAVIIFQSAIASALLLLSLVFLISDRNPRYTVPLISICKPRYTPCSILSDRAPPQ